MDARAKPIGTPGNRACPKSGDRPGDMDVGRRPGFTAWLLAALLPALLAVSFLAQEVRAQYFGQNKVPRYNRSWRVMESAHFDLHFYPEESEMAVEALRLAERAYTRLSRVLGHEIDERIPLLIYASQTEFRETRAVASLIGEGTGGLTEFLKRRVIVPFMGSYAELDHVITHELVHAFQIDMLNRPRPGGGRGMISWAPPLWVMEGMAEYFSTPGLDVHTEMWMRDAVLEGDLLTVDHLSRVHDIRVYRFGQSLVSHIARSFGDEAIGAWFRSMARRRSFSRGTEESIGLTAQSLSADWFDSLRSRHLPELVRHYRGAAIARKLTNHRDALASFYIAPAVSPDGGEMVYISNETLYTDLYLASAIDGSRSRRLIRGQRKESFETFRFIRTSLDWSPDGDRVALVTRTGGREQLVVFNVRRKKVERGFYFDLDEILSPIWSPDGGRLAFVGLQKARSDIYVVTADGDSLRKLTDDDWAALHPAWSPDGRYIAFSTDRGYCSAACTEGYSPWKIGLLELATGEISLLPDQVGKNINPQWFPDGRHLLYVSDRTGISNIFVRDLGSGLDYQLTDFLTGISGIAPNSAAVSLSGDGHRVVFSLFEEGGLNLYAIREPLGLLEKASPWQPALTWGSEATASDEGLPLFLGPERQEAAAEGRGLLAKASPPRARPDEGEPHGGRGDTMLSVPPPIGEHPVEVDLGDLFEETQALPESLEYKERAYKPRLSVDLAHAGGLYASGFGLQAQSVIVLSDILGDKNLYFAVEVSGKLEEGNYLIGYRNLGLRPSFDVSLYQYWTGYGSGLLPGYLEEFEQRQLRGLGVAWIHPLSRFKRVKLGVDIVYEKSYHYIYRGSGAWNARDYEWEQQRKESWYVQPQVSWVFDSAIFGPTGPLSGRRTRLSAYGTIGKRNSGGVGVDHRLYFNIRQRYALAWRGVIAGEWGPDRSRLVCGGPYSLRGFTDCPLWGDWIAFSNLELRFPFIEHLYIAWPIPLLIGGIRGSLFFDMGAAWSEIGEFRSVSCKNENNLCELDDLKTSFGLRTSMNVGIAILRWDLVRRSKMSRWDGKTKGEFSIGMEF